MSKYTVFAIVDRPNERPWRQHVMTAQLKKRVVGDQVIEEKGDVIAPNAMGLYIVNESDEFCKERIKALKDKMKRENTASVQRIIGPFEGDDLQELIEESQKEVFRVRPRSDREKVAEVEAIRAKDREAYETEKAELEAELAELKAMLEADTKPKDEPQGDGSKKKDK